MSDIQLSLLHELISDADKKREEAFVASVSEIHFDTEWPSLIVEEAATLDKRMRFLNRFRKLPNFILGTNVPIRSRGFNEYEAESFHTPLMFESVAELSGNYHAISSGLTAASYLHRGSSPWHRSVTVKRWLTDTAPDGSNMSSRPDVIAQINFEPRFAGNGKDLDIDGKKFSDFDSKYWSAARTQAIDEGKQIDYMETMSDIVYPQEFYISTLGVLRAFNVALRSKLSGPTDGAMID